MKIVMDNPVITFGHRGLDSLIGESGLFRGGFTEIAGPPQSGKTTVMLVLTARVMAAGGTVAWVNADNTFSPQLASLCGVNTESLLLVPHRDAESLFTLCAQLAGDVDLLVIDPLSALGSALEISSPGFSEEMAKSHFRAISNGLRTLFSAIALSRTAVLLASQQRWNPQRGIISASNDEELEYYASLRLHTEIKRRETGGGSYHTVEIKQCRADRQVEGRKVSFFFDPQTGLEPDDGLIDLAFEKGIIQVNPNGGWVMAGWGALPDKEAWMHRLRGDAGLRLELDARLDALDLLEA